MKPLQVNIFDENHCFLESLKLDPVKYRFVPYGKNKKRIPTETIEQLLHDNNIFHKYEIILYDSIRYGGFSFVFPSYITITTLVTDDRPLPTESKTPMDILAMFMLNIFEND